MLLNNRAARVIAYYLPQFHPTPENDMWWGKGFTEWTNTAKAKPMFRGHYQPHIPSDLGFYDLRVPETRREQALMASEYGMEAFCYYHYWFAGRRILERPFNEVLESGEPKFPFCLCWANHSWTGIWAGCPGKTLIEQTYPGKQDDYRHFDVLLKAFHDNRYLKIDGKPLFIIYDPMSIPNVNKLTDLWRKMATKGGLKGIYLIGAAWRKGWNPKEYGFDGSTPKDNLPTARKQYVPPTKPIKKIIQLYSQKYNKPLVYSYKQYIYENEHMRATNKEYYPCVIPNWDNTPRSGWNGLVLHGSTPELFKTHLQMALKIIEKYTSEHKIIFIKSWNEWAEGNHLEPDLKYGKSYLQVVKDLVINKTDNIYNENKE
jgi:lipopolysaccharide biosynthesis protein